MSCLARSQGACAKKKLRTRGKEVAERKWRNYKKIGNP
jgi:hypothetical protein